MSTVRVYKSTDPGAPAHPSATRGSMAALLRACLVTGYGSGENFKAPAGWEEPFAESNNKACFRALSGARAFFQIDDTQDNANVVRIYGFESMSDVATGIGWGRTNYFGKLYTSGTPRWTVIADEKTCYVMLGNTDYQTPHCFGEYSSYLNNDIYNSLLSGHSNDTDLPNGHGVGLLTYMAGQDVDWTQSNYNVDSYGHVHKAFNGNASAFTLGVAANSTNNPVGGTAHVHPLTEGIKAPILPLFLAVGDWSTTVGTGTRLFRGHLRGLRVPYAHRPYADNTVVTLDGVDYQVLNVSSISSVNTPFMTQLLFKLGDWEN